MTTNALPKSYVPDKSSVFMLNEDSEDDFIYHGGLPKTIKLKSQPNSPKLIPLDKPLKKKKDDVPAIDEGFDYVNFPSLTPDEQLNSIPKEFYQHIQFENKIRTRSHHSCTLTKHHDNHSGTWACDKVKGVSDCLSGITGFYQSKGI